MAVNLGDVLTALPRPCVCRFHRRRCRSPRGGSAGIDPATVLPARHHDEMSHRVLEMTCSTFTLPESSSVLPRQGDTAQFSVAVTHTHDLRRPSAGGLCFRPPEGGTGVTEPSSSL